MTDPNNTIPGGEKDEERSDPLIERLARLEWPEVDPNQREQAWERFKALAVARGESPADSRR